MVEISKENLKLLKAAPKRPVWKAQMIKETLQQRICDQLCSDIRLIEKDNGKLMLSTPFVYPDGDHYSIYLREIHPGTIRISDEANTIMRLSYETANIDRYFSGTRGELMKQILREHQVQEEQGNFYIDVSVDEVSQGVFILGQALTEIYSLSYLDRERPENTFYDDLEDTLKSIIRNTDIKLYRNHLAPDLLNAENYIIDYSLINKDKTPFFLFGVPSVDKAKLVTIILQYLHIQKYRMRTFLVYQNQEKFPAKHLSRLTEANIDGSQVSSLEKKPIEQNINNHFMYH